MADTTPENTLIPTPEEIRLTEELKAARSTGPSETEGPLEDKATPYAVTVQNNRVTRKWGMVH